MSRSLDHFPTSAEEPTAAQVRSKISELIPDCHTRRARSEVLTQLNQEFGNHPDLYETLVDELILSLVLEMDGSARLQSYRIRF